MRQRSYSIAVPRAMAARRGLMGFSRAPGATAVMKFSRQANPRVMACPALAAAMPARQGIRTLCPGVFLSVPAYARGLATTSR